MTGPILFYHQNEKPYGAFSNFSDHGVTINGKYYATTEHYFQAMKFSGNPDYQEAIRNADTPGLSKRMGGSRVKPGYDPNWEINKIEVMMTALRAKFTQHKKLKTLLLSTGDRQLVEHTTIDKEWADGGDGGDGTVGKNKLGKCLMRLRDELNGKQ